MEDLLNKDMTDALNAVEPAPADKVILQAILFQERANKDRAWDDDDALTTIVKLLEASEDAQ